MSQDTILRLLKRNKERWFTAKEITKILKINNGSVTRALRQIRNPKLVRFRTIKNSSNVNIFQYKHKIT